MTLNGHFALCFEIHASFGAHHKNLNETDTYYQRQKCRPLTLVSGDIRFMRIFAEVRTQEGASNDSEVIENVDFQRIWTLYVFGTLGNEANIII